MKLFSAKETGKTQADGPFTISLGVADMLSMQQVQVELSDTPNAGTLTVSIRSPKASEFVRIGSIDLTSSELLKVFGPAYVAEMKFTPASLDSDVTYNVILNSGKA